MERVVIADPCIGEFGWELMSWQGYVRARATGAEYSVVCSTRGFEPIYANINATFVPHSIEGQRDGLAMKPCSTPGKLQAARNALNSYAFTAISCGHKVERLQLPKRLPIPLDQQEFFKYGTVDKTCAYEVIVHARNRQHSLPFGGANYPLHYWRYIIDALYTAGYRRVASIGSRDASHHVPNTDDLRGIKLRDLFNVLASARLVIGPSSGPMHLASLCGTPHLVWAGDRVQPIIRTTNKARYEKLWNPFNTPVKVILEPTKGPVTRPEVIIAAMHKMLKGA